jgi:DNA recombination protein RmuC
MPLADVLLSLLLLAALATLALQVALLRRGRSEGGLAVRLDALKQDSERLERTLREEQRAGREELQQGFDRFRGHVGEQLSGVSRHQAERIDGFAQRLDTLTASTDAGLQALAQRLTEDARKSREELTLTLARAGEQQRQQLAALTADNEKRLAEVRATL